MSGLLAKIAAAFMGFATGAVLVLAGLYCFPFHHLTRTERVLPLVGDGRVLEQYTLDGYLDRPGTIVALSHGGITPFATLPAGEPLIPEPVVRSGLALITRVHDAKGEIVGVATELEAGHEDSNLLAGKLMTHTTWTVVLPGRGGLFLYQTEDNWWLATRIIGPAVLGGESWKGTWHHLNTIGPRPDGHGEIVAATGRFANRPGTFVEHAEMREFTPDGRMDFSMHVLLAFEPRVAGAAAGGAPR